MPERERVRVPSGQEPAPSSEEPGDREQSRRPSGSTKGR